MLGSSLVEVYKEIGMTLSEPDLRAKMEADMRAIAEGSKDCKDVLRQQLESMRELFVTAVSKKKEIEGFFEQRF